MQSISVAVSQSLKFRGSYRPRWLSRDLQHTLYRTIMFTLRVYLWIWQI